MERAKERGFTLLELVLVLAIIAVLASIFLPIGMNALKETDVTKANADVQELATALTQFFKDLRYMPACDGADCDPRIATGTGDNNNLAFLAVGDGSGDLSGKYPPEATTKLSGTATFMWDLATNDESTAAKNNFFNHVVINNPDHSATVGEAGVDYTTTGGRRWRGPYVSRLGPDPWGNAYIVSIGAMEADGSPITKPTTNEKSKGWIISAGPNGILETAPDASSLGGDDIGFIFFTE
jgi:prepilin-type N-terminal cleavage/methylation domain-containing protein